MTQWLRDPAAHSTRLLASGRKNVQIVANGSKAAGDITYAANLSAGATVTVNGVVFTAIAAGATGAQFNIGATLTLTLDALAAVLNASTNPLVSVATYSNSGGTKLAVSYDKAVAAGNLFTLAASAGGTVSGARLTGGRTADKIDLDENAVIELVTAATGTNEGFVLPMGDEGQEITLFLKSKGGSNSAVVSGSFAGGTTATFDAVADYVRLQVLGGIWRPVVTSSVTFA